MINYNTIKIIHTVLAGLLLGSAFFTFLLLFVARREKDSNEFERLAHSSVRLFWVAGLPLLFIQIGLALILIGLKTPAISGHLIATLFAWFVFVFMVFLTALWMLQRYASQLKTRKCFWSVCLLCLLLATLGLAVMVYWMARIGLVYTSV